MIVERYKRRFWAVKDEKGKLICVCVYRKGAREVRRRLRSSIHQEPKAFQKKVRPVCLTTSGFRARFSTEGEG